MPEISIYRRASDTDSRESINIDDFIARIQNGYWQDQIIALRRLKNKDEQDLAKKKLPMATVAGVFSTPRSDKTLTKHSGFIQIDIDGLEDKEDAKSYLYADEHVYAGFDSCRGHGLCLIFRINGKKHRETFAGIDEYLYTRYKIIVDKTSVNESRGRFVSFDPYLYYNPNAKKFEYYPEKKKEKKHPNIIFTQSDFDLIIQQIQNRQIDIAPGYQEWLHVAFGLTDKFGEHGRAYFHAISQFHPDYNYTACDKQYDACLKSHKSGRTIATVYYYAKQAGIATVSEETRKIAQSAVISKRAGKDKETAAQVAPKSAQSKEVLEQIFDKNIQVFDDDSIISKLKTYLQQSYNIKRNEITRRIEVDGKVMDDILFNSIWCDAVKIFDKVSPDTLRMVIHSNFIKSYNPFNDFFVQYQNRNPIGIIDEFISCIESDGGLSYNEFFPEYTSFFIRKWLVSIISAMHYVHSPLMLVFTGGKNTGKTEVFRRLLPEQLSAYYAEISSGMKDTDFHIMMTQKIIVMDDEMETRTRSESKAIKSLTSKEIFTVRSPYGRYNEDLRRLSVLCGTTNEQEIISDIDGNRRILPIPIQSIDYHRMNKIDRIDLLMEAYWLWKSGFKWEVGKDDIKLLEENSQRFQEIPAEKELLIKYFRKPADGEISFHMMATEIKSYIEHHSQQKTNKKHIIALMKKMDFEYKQKKVNGIPVWGFSVMKNNVTQ